MRVWTNSFSFALNKSRSLDCNHFKWSIENQSIRLSNFSLVCNNFIPNFKFNSDVPIPSQRENTNEPRHNPEPLSYFISMSRFHD